VDPADNRGNTVQLDPVFSHTSRPLLGKIEPASFGDKLPVGLIMFMQGEVIVKQLKDYFSFAHTTIKSFCIEIYDVFNIKRRKHCSNG
jgi:hypothetical protein